MDGGGRTVALDPRQFIRLHAGMPEHPKVDPLSDSGFRALVDAWCLCRRTGNDGRIPIASWTKRYKLKARNELIAAGLVHLESDAAVMHDWLEHQPSADDLEEKRQVRVEAGRLGGQRSAETRRARSKPPTKIEAFASTEPKQMPKQMPEQTLKQNGSKVQPELDKELEKEGGYVGEGTHESIAPATEPPSRNCSKHPDGTTDRCGPCGDARRAREDWDRLVGDRATRERKSRRALIDGCQWCDDNGMRHEPASLKLLDLPAVRCDHTAMSNDEWLALVPAEAVSHA